MRLDDRLALRNSVENLCNTMGDIIPHDILDKQRRECDTNDWSDKVPPGAAVRNQLLFYQPLDEMDERFE